VDIHQAYLVLADIGGYTRFIAAHGMALAHAEAVITRLLESVIDSSRHPLKLNKLEGDAAFFFALAPATNDSARDVLGQARRFFSAFDARQTRMKVCDCCGCEACKALGRLHLKAIVHHGEVALKKVRKFEELAGKDVIIAHRLLKNSVQQHRYMLITEPVVRAAGDALPPNLERRVEGYENLGEVTAFLFDPPESPPAEGEKGSEWEGIRQYLAFQWYWLLKSLGLRRQRFPNLEAACSSDSPAVAQVAPPESV
jgi:hypothetical protein